jgi:hypothetical protein
MAAMRKMPNSTPTDISVILPPPELGAMMFIVMRTVSSMVVQGRDCARYSMDKTLAS